MNFSRLQNFSMSFIPLSMHTTGTSTANLTLFEAAIAAQETLNETRHDFNAQ